MVNILIGNSDVNFAVELMNELCSISSEIRVMGIATTERKVVEMMNDNFDIDVVLLNEKFANENMYVDVLQQVEDLSRYKSTCIIISEENNNITEHECIYSYVNKNLGKNTIIREVKNLLEFIKNNKRNIEEIKQKIINELKKLGFDLSYKGTKYLISAIEYIVINSHKNIDKLEKAIYPMIAKKYNSTVHNVKGDVTRATTMMYYNCESKKLQKYFCLGDDTKPKVKMIITTIANRIS